MKETSNSNTNQTSQIPTDQATLHARIEQRAYDIWLASGGRHGEDLSHWLQAEREILKTARQDQTGRTSKRRGCGDLGGPIPLRKAL